MKIIGSVIFFTVLALLLLGLIPDKPPQLFPLDDPSGTYTITHTDSGYMIHYDTTTEKSDVLAFVGNSPVKYSSLANRRLEIEGEFEYSNRQCDPNGCIDLPNSVVLNITSAKTAD